MGGVHKKPISSLEKRQRKEEAKRRKERVMKEERIESKTSFVASELLAKAQREIKGIKVITPYTLMGKLNVTYSVAKDILEVLERKNVVKLMTRNRRVAVYVPAEIANKIALPPDVL